MYRFKKEKYLELLDGRTADWLANKIGYSNVTLSYIFNCHRNCKKATAIAIVKTLNVDYEVEDFFEKVSEGE